VDVSLARGVRSGVCMTNDALRDIVDTTVVTGLTTLARALAATDLGTTLRLPGPFTVFAPNNDAFGQLPAGMLRMLFLDRPWLTALLQHHVVPHRLSAADLIGQRWIEPLRGRSLVIGLGQGLTVDDVHLVETDVPASNGLVHVVDGIVWPLPGAPATRFGPEVPQLAGASAATFRLAAGH
jgi:uncharacterized surface protein with fasciclin (FAS1) repeats